MARPVSTPSTSRGSHPVLGLRRRHHSPSSVVIHAHQIPVWHARRTSVRTFTMATQSAAGKKAASRQRRHRRARHPPNPGIRVADAQRGKNFDPGCRWPPRWSSLAHIGRRRPVSQPSSAAAHGPAVFTDYRRGICPSCRAINSSHRWVEPGMLTAMTPRFHRRSAEGTPRLSRFCGSRRFDGASQRINVGAASRSCDFRAADCRVRRRRYCRRGRRRRRTRPQ